MRKRHLLEFVASKTMRYHQSAQKKGYELNLKDRITLANGLSSS